MCDQQSQSIMCDQQSQSIMCDHSLMYQPQVCQRQEVWPPLVGFLPTQADSINYVSPHPGFLPTLLFATYGECTEIVWPLVQLVFPSILLHQSLHSTYKYGGREEGSMGLQIRPWRVWCCLSRQTVHFWVHFLLLTQFTQCQCPLSHVGDGQFERMVERV